MKTKNYRSSPGFTLLEVMISVGIMIFAMAAISQLMVDTDSGIKVAQLIETRDEIARNIAQTLQRYDQIVYAAQHSSHPGNQAINSCITKPDLASNTNATPQCVSSDGSRPQTFLLVVKGSAGPLAGDLNGANAVYYDRKGRRCDSGDTSCHFWQAKTWFYATCISPQTAGGSRQTSNRCFQARSISFQYQVSLKDPSLLARIKNAPANIRDKPQRREEATITHQVGGLLANQKCPTFSLAVGYTLDGRIVCQCMPGSNQLPGLNPDGSIRCATPTTSECGPKEFFRGVDATGKPICIKRNLRCGVPADTGGQSMVRCNEGGWLTQFNFGDCWASSSNKKGDDRPIHCKQYGGSCCQYDSE